MVQERSEKEAAQQQAAQTAAWAGGPEAGDAGWEVGFGLRV